VGFTAPLRSAGRPCDVIIYLAARTASIGGIKFRATRTASRETRDKPARAVATSYTSVISERDNAAATALDITKRSQPASLSSNPILSGRRGIAAKSSGPWQGTFNYRACTGRRGGREKNMKT